MTSVLLITEGTQWNSLFHPKLIFKTLTDEHILRLLLLQKIKRDQSLSDTIKIYLDNIELGDMNISPKLYHILKYECDTYHIKILDIHTEIDRGEIEEYNKKVSLKYSK
jgi:hypothetical protein